MHIWRINEIIVNADDGISYEEALCHVQNEQLKWQAKNKIINRIELHLSDDKESIDISTYEKSPIRRVRRITGYAAEINSFNSAKLAELRDRVKHI